MYIKRFLAPHWPILRDQNPPSGCTGENK